MIHDHVHVHFYLITPFSLVSLWKRSHFPLFFSSSLSPVYIFYIHKHMTCNVISIIWQIMYRSSGLTYGHGLIDSDCAWMIYFLCVKMIRVKNVILVVAVFIMEDYTDVFWKREVVTNNLRLKGFSIVVLISSTSGSLYFRFRNFNSWNYLIKGVNWSTDIYKLTFFIYP